MFFVNGCSSSNPPPTQHQIAVQEPKEMLETGSQECPKYLISGSEDGTIRLWDLSNKGMVLYRLEQDAGISCMMQSQLKGAVHFPIVVNF